MARMFHRYKRDVHTILEQNKKETEEDVEEGNWVKPLHFLQRTQNLTVVGGDGRVDGRRKTSGISVELAERSLVPVLRRHVCFKENMSSKKKRSEGRSGESVEKAEEIFQAVILSDSFNFRFLPITFETPRVSEL